MEQAKLTGSTDEGWAALLKQATVRITVPTDDPNSPWEGTGFIIAPGIVATCAHVVARRIEQLPQQVNAELVALGRTVTLQVDPDHFFRVGDDPVDLALLHETDGGQQLHGLTPVLLSPTLRIGDDLWTYGHPGKARAGQPASFTYQSSTRRDLARNLELPRGYGVPVGAGYSGSAVVNRRTGAVCGMLTTSDSKGSAHLIPIAVLLDRCPLARAMDTVPAHLEWLRTLDDDQLAAGGWRYAGPRLRDYLTAVVNAARSHPYPSVLPDIRSSDLLRVYVRQQVHPGPYARPDTAFGEADRRDVLSRPGDPDPARGISSPRGRLKADVVLSADHDSLLLGGPGAGKSSLLRVAVAELAERWLDDAGWDCAVLPVRILASDLLSGGSMAERIAAGVRDDVGTVPRSALPEGLFGRAPMPGVRWLVLIDGLDEITDPRQRGQVVAILRSQRHGPYRFVLASRPLPDPELADLQRSGEMHTYELLPLEADELPSFAEAWFREADLPDPVTAARDFMALLDHADLADLARTPLMSTLLCQLYANDSTKPLPRGRYGVYEEFVALLYRTAAAPNIRAEIAHDLAELPDHVFLTALPRLAVARLDGDPRPTLDLIAKWVPDSLRPSGTPAQTRAWSRQVGEYLRRCGLMTERAGDFVFLHDTLTEFLAARHIASHDFLRSMQEFRDIFPIPPSPGAYPDPERDYVWYLSVTTPAPPITSFQLLLIAAWVSSDASQERSLVRVFWRRRVANALWRTARGRSHTRGPELIADLVAERVPLHPSTIRAAADMLSAQAKHGSVGAARALYRMGDQRALDQLMALATDRTVDADARIDAALNLAELDNPRGVDQLMALATDPTQTADTRARAALWLGALGDKRASDQLAALATNVDVVPSARAIAASQLGRLGDPRGADQLVLLATDPAIDDNTRVITALQLGLLHDPRGADQLMALATDRTLNLRARHQATSLLAGLGDPRAADQLMALAADPTVDSELRIDCAMALDVLKDRRGAEQLVALATDPMLHRRVRVSAVHALFGYGRIVAAPRKEAVEALAGLTSDLKLPRYVRRAARRLLRDAIDRGD